MKTKIFSLVTLWVLGWALNATAAFVDQDLADRLATANPNDQLKVLVVLASQLDLNRLSLTLDAQRVDRARRHFEVLTQARDLAEETQEPLVEMLEAGRERSEVISYKTFWITNAIAVQAKPDFIRRLLKRSDVSAVYWDSPIELIAPIGEPRYTDSIGDGVENGITVTRAPELWAMGIDGAGSLACDQDTGADGTHPAFANRWRGLDVGVQPAAAWFDPVAGETFPTDSDSHGTHTLGTMVGDDGAGNQVGMAPGAKWIGAKTIDVPGGSIYSDAVAAFEWSADPDDDPSTLDDVPDVVNNSWGISGFPHCDDAFWAAIDTAEAAGVVVIFAAGNEGPMARSLRSPGDRITSQCNVFSVGALNQNATTIASFSSRGPSRCDDATIKPEVSAVGVEVRSSMPDNSYGTMDGTSMAAPHVSGAVLLLRQAFPEALPDEIKTALYMSAVDLGEVGEDNTFGMGCIDVVAAYEWLLDNLIFSDGKVALGELFTCADIIQITVKDIDLIGATQEVSVQSTTETTPETVMLQQTGTAGEYEGEIAATAGAPAHGDNLLSLTDGDTITVTYIDADDGNGNFNVEKTAAAASDCAAPTFGGLTAAEAGDYEVTLSWNQATDAHTVVYNVYRAESSGGQDFNAPTYTITALTMVDKDVENNRAYYYIVRAEDTLGSEDSNTVELAASPMGPDRIFRETFEPLKDLSEWTIVNSGSCPATWAASTCVADWCDGIIALADRNNCFPFLEMYEIMVTPAIDCTGYTDIELLFDHSFSGVSGDVGDVDYSLDGTTWTRIVRYSGIESVGDQTYPLPELDGQQQVYFRYRFETGAIGGAWGIDQVELVGWPAADDDDDVADDDTTDDDIADDDVADDDSADDDVADDDSADDDVADDDTVDDDATDDDAVDDDDDDDDACGC